MPFQPHTPPCPSKPVFSVLLTQAWPQVYAHTQEECVNSEDGLQFPTNSCLCAAQSGSDSGDLSAGLEIIFFAPMGLLSVAAAAEVYF